MTTCYLLCICDYDGTSNIAVYLSPDEPERILVEAAAELERHNAKYPEKHGTRPLDWYGDDSEVVPGHCVYQLRNLCILKLELKP